MEHEGTNVIRQNQSFWTNAIETTIIALVILVPIVFYPWCITVFLPAKETLAEVLVLLALMFWLLKMTSREEIKFNSTPLSFPILSFISICILSLIWSNSFFVSLKELPLFLAGPLLYFITTNNINNERQINRILNILLLVAGLFGIYGIFQYKGIDFAFWKANIGRQQVFGLFGNVNYFAEYLIVPLPIAVSLFFVTRNKFKKNLLLMGILAMGICLIVTFTRGSYLAFGTSLIFMFLLFIFSSGKTFIKENKKILIVVFLAIIISVSLFVIPNPLNKPDTLISKIKDRISVTQLTQGTSIKRRIAIWKFTALMIKDHPLLGSGIGTYKYNTLRYQAKFFDQGENRSLYPSGFADKAHNEYLQLWAELGIIGLGIFLWLIVRYLTYGIKKLKEITDKYRQGIIIGLMGSVVAVLVDGLFGFPLHLPATIVLFWLALALSIVMIKIEVNASAAEENNNLKKSANYKAQGEEKDNNISRFKPLLYIVIILLTFFLCITVIRPFIARVHWYYLNREIRNEDWDKALKISGEALRWDPYLGQVYYNMGKILLKREFYGVALQYFEKAARYTDLPDLPQNFALSYLKKGKLNEASIWLRQAILYQPDKKSMVPLYSELGNVYLRLKRYRPAEIAFKNALKIKPKYVNAHYGLAGAYLNQNKTEEALAELQKVIDLAPDSKEANYARITMQKIAQEKLKAQPTETDNP